MASRSFLQSQHRRSNEDNSGSSVNSSGNVDGAEPAAGGSEGEEHDPKYPLWKYVKNTEKTGGRIGGNAKFECVFCAQIINGSYSRVKAHLLKISNAGVNKYIYLPLYFIF